MGEDGDHTSFARAKRCIGRALLCCVMLDNARSFSRSASARNIRHWFLTVHTLSHSQCNKGSERGFASKWARRSLTVRGLASRPRHPHRWCESSQFGDLHFGGAGGHSEGPLRCTFYLCRSLTLQDVVTDDNSFVVRERETACYHVVTTSASYLLIAK